MRILGFITIIFPVLSPLSSDSQILVAALGVRGLLYRQL